LIGPANNGKDIPYLLQRVREGRVVSAREWNLVTEAINRANTGVNGPSTAVGGLALENAKKPFRQVKIKVILSDHLSCVEFDGTNEGDPINVAKPYQLRGSLLEHNSVTFVHDSTTQRTASASGENDEIQVIVPAYVVDDVIIAFQNIVGGNSAKDLKGNSFGWMDLNVDARAWAKQAA